jgi:circadian clock protein KaiB
MCGKVPIQGHLGGRCEFEVIDVKEDFRTALESNVFVTPMLIRVSPPPGVKILGNLSDTDKVLRALEIKDAKG